MIYINHRINSLEQLKEVPLQNGIELDIRYHENNLVLHHDAFHHHENNPEKFELLVKAWENTGTMILNVKTEGIEKECITLMHKNQITNWFFLDLSMPYFAIYAELAKKNVIKGFTIDNLAVRFSEREPIEYALAFSGKARWVWVDCFTYLPMNQIIYSKLKKANFKICLVSPELQGHSLDCIEQYKQQVQNLEIEAVCTKKPDLWK